MERKAFETFDRFAARVMTAESYASAERFFWMFDSGTDYRGRRSIDRFHGRWLALRLVYLPVHTSWLDQIEISFSVLQRRALSPGDFATREALADGILGFQGNSSAWAPTLRVDLYP